MGAFKLTTIVQTKKETNSYWLDQEKKNIDYKKTKEKTKLKKPTIDPKNKKTNNSAHTLTQFDYTAKTK